MASAAVAVFVSWSYLRPEIVQGDALVHHYWMRRATNGPLFNDPLTAQLQESARYPDGYELLFEIAARFTDPVVFGEWLGVGLMAASSWLVFCIVRLHTTWWPAAWLGGALFLGLSDIHRFYGGFPRGFTQPAVLLTVLLSMTDRHLGAAAVASVTALFYPPAALLAVGVLLVASLKRQGRRGLRLDAIRARFAGAALALTLLATAGPVIVGDRRPELMTAQQARAYPEFTGRFFEPSLRTYLQQNRSGFDLRASGSLLALAALALLVVRPRNCNLLRKEVLALPVVALGGFTLAHALLFRLYLPHRYTYPLLAFVAIAIAVTLRPTWSFVLSRDGRG